ncbi:hypothetical protein G6F70_003198 [Rhizopus microsporus]|uniref:SET domain-containing protein n=1 Tax=Rhizopus microsporus TaxID=58291 RepID=A0A1X0S4X5_RHIZD|nr:hypothetical protein G6F71_002863 [Rhizopus microsporus]KAG1201385.1 hypothetical protein G6F70_003198 [Rhizopus microsporus]KAG1214641.1 hypothetical protein G6F69_001747 [Rhizopus microsporus]KAG1235747.1 hypothetical protein G6F67_002521 [Rhizopus microsporus]KAG1267043.1 hypothetical protein G6F68_002251 [Rhizopus microsporus]
MQDSCTHATPISYPLQWFKLRGSAVNKASDVVLHSAPLDQEKAVEAVKRTFQAIDFNSLTFSVHTKKSSIPGAGLGVYLSGQRQTRGQIVCFYPGTIYLPSDPILFVSIANEYILKCVDGLYVDGKSTGLSGRIYRSVYKRENWPGAIEISDCSWMNQSRRSNPLAIGQMVNNCTGTHKANVCYQEIDLPIQFPSELRKYIPNMYWNTIIDPMSYPMRVVALVTLRDVEPGEELFSTYMDLVHS